MDHPRPKASCFELLRLLLPACVLFVASPALAWEDPTWGDSSDEKPRDPRADEFTHGFEVSAGFAHGFDAYGGSSGFTLEGGYFYRQPSGLLGGISGGAVVFPSADMVLVPFKAHLIGFGGIHGMRATVYALAEPYSISELGGGLAVGGGGRVGFDYPILSRDSAGIRQWEPVWGFGGYFDMSAATGLTGVLEGEVWGVLTVGALARWQ